jgi:hypothetical protein
LVRVKYGSKLNLGHEIGDLRQQVLFVMPM